MRRLYHGLGPVATQRIPIVYLGMKIIDAKKISKAAKQGAKTLGAARGDSSHAAELRRQLGLSAGLALAAGTIGFFAIRAAKCASSKANEHVTWRELDRRLDEDLADSLDASDAVARY